MTDKTITRAAEVLPPSDDDPGDGRTLRLRMVRWDTPANTPEGYRESFKRGAFAGVDAGRVTIESAKHGGPLVGRGTAIEETEDGGYLTGRIAKTPAGDELLTLIGDGVLREASVVYQPVTTSRDGDVLVREAVDLWRVAVVERGVHQGAEVVAVRAAEPRRAVMDVATATEQADDVVARAITAVTDRIERQDRRIEEAITRAVIPVVREARPGEDAGSLGELLIRAWDGEGGDLIKRALVDQILIPDNQALARPAFLTDAVGIVNLGRPAIQAFGGPAGLPDSGMRLEWPELVPLTGRAIGVQATEKTEVTSVKVSFTTKGANLTTYAGASDISIQLLRRSSPAYRDLYARVMLAEYARVTEDAFCDALVAGATGVVDYVIGSDTDGTKLMAALFAASVKVQRATGAPASAAVVAEDVFVKIGGWLRPVGPTNQIGTGNAAGLNVTVNGIQIVLGGADLAAGTILVGNSRAATWYEDGPNTIEATDVAKLGVNVGYYGIAGTALPVPQGIVRVYDAP